MNKVSNNGIAAGPIQHVKEFGHIFYFTIIAGKGKGNLIPSQSYGPNTSRAIITLVS